jgi:Tol biopolymer transport system component
VFAGSPDWSWTSNEIVYAVDLAGLQRTPPADGVAWELFGIQPDGSGLRQITTLGGGARLHAPRWAPDGRSIEAKQYDHNAGGGRLIDPASGAVSAWLTGLEEARPLVRPVGAAS